MKSVSKIPMSPGLLAITSHLVVFSTFIWTCAVYIDNEVSISYTYYLNPYLSDLSSD